MRIDRLARQVESLDEWKLAVAAQGKMAEAFRRDLLSNIAKGRLSDGDKVDAMRLVIGSLSGMQDRGRCLDWWEAVSVHPLITRAALAQGLPFGGDIMDHDDRWDIFNHALSKEGDAAWMMWKSLRPGSERDDFFQLLMERIAYEYSEKIEKDQEWLSSFSEVASGLGTARKTSVLARFLVDRTSLSPGSNEAQSPFLTPWVEAFFPEGMSHEEERLLKEDACVFAESWASVRASIEAKLDDVLLPIVRMRERAEIESITPAVSTTSPRRF